MAPDTETPADACPPVTLPPGSSFPVCVDVPIRGLLLRDAEDLADLNRLLAQIRRIPQGEKRVRQPNPTPTSYQWPAAYTEEDGRVMFDTVVWLDEVRSSGALPQYQGMHVAALEKRILDADRDPDALDRRLAALGDSVPLHRIVYRYFPGPDDPPY